MGKTSGTLTYDELVIACRNIGVNLECGGCAENFYTGYNDPSHHDPQCPKKRKILELVKVRKIAGSVCVSLPKSILDPLGITCGDKLLIEVDQENQQLIITPKYSLG